jgi:hypothetical protein
MVDRIADPWGPRTPFGRGEKWPVRVDSFLAAGHSEADVQRWVPTASVLHSNGDAMDVAVIDDRIVGVRGRAGDRINHGRVDRRTCTAGRPTTARTGCAGRWSARAIAWWRPTGTRRWVGSWPARTSC